ncbi:MAG: efflux RND transporter periplasmic adaptor subunit, partial [Pseudomonadota bacterium]
MTIRYLSLIRTFLYRFFCSNISSSIAVFVVILCCFLWMLSGEQLIVKQASLKENTIIQQSENTNSPLPIKALRLTAEAYYSDLSVKAITSPIRSIMIRSRTTSRVEFMYAKKGQFVNQDDWIAQLDIGERLIHISAANSALAKSESELTAALKLGFSDSELELRHMAGKAAKKTAQADLASAELELAHTQIKAPFDGFIENTFIEQGSFIQKGQSIAHLMDLKQLKITAQIHESDIANVQIATKITFKPLFSTRTYTGTISYISPKANTQYASFEVEAIIDNPDHALHAGLDGTLTFELKPRSLFKVPHDHIIAYDDGIEGIITIKNNRLQFKPIDIIDRTKHHVWVNDP